MTPCPDGLALPYDAQLGPNCGVTAVAVAAGVTFTAAWNHFKPKKPKKWTGITNVNELEAALRTFGKVASTKVLAKQRSLKEWVRVYSQPGAVYLVRTGNHFQIVRDQWVLDQFGVKHISEFGGRNKRVSHVMVVQ